MIDAALLLPDLRICRGCGCSDIRACPGGCSWVLLDLDAPSGICSLCAELFEWDMLAMINANLAGAGR